MRAMKMMPLLKVPEVKMPEVKAPQFMRKQAAEEEEEAPRQAAKKQKAVVNRNAKRVEEAEAEKFEDDASISNDGSVVGKIKDFFGII